MTSKKRTNESAERDELADLYADILYRYHGIVTSSSKEAADELLEAGYRKSRGFTVIVPEQRSLLKPLTRRGE